MKSFNLSKTIRQFLLLSTICGASGCMSTNKETKAMDDAIERSSIFTKKAMNLYTCSPDSLEAAISYMDSAITIYPSENNYLQKIEYCMSLGDRARAMDASREYWEANEEGYSMAIATGLLYDIGNQKELAEKFYLKAKNRLRKIRDNHNDIFYKLDQKYIDILIHGSAECKELYEEVTDEMDVEYINALINHIDTLTSETIKSTWL